VSAIIEEWRRRIDELDAQIVSLLNRRAEYTLKIGREKRKLDQPLRSKEREAQVLKRVSTLNRGPLSDDALQRIYRVIMEEALLLEQRSHSDEADGSR